MEDGDVEKDLDFPQDEIERKIKRLENELARVSTIEDKKVLWGALGILVFVLSFKLLNFNPIVVIILIPTVIFGGLGHVIYENIRQKRNILIKHGMKCPECGYIPHILNASGVYYSKQCLKCRSKLNV